MKKLEDFKVKKVEVKKIYGGRYDQTCVDFPASITVGGSNAGNDDGPCTMED